MQRQPASALRQIAQLAACVTRLRLIVEGQADRVDADARRFDLFCDLVGTGHAGIV
jgi:hypothetical protein